MRMASSQKPPLWIIGIGNTLAGDDGAGIKALERLREHFGDHAAAFGLTFSVLCGDLYAVSDMLSPDHRFLFLDAAAGDSPGKLLTITGPHAPVNAPSLHQLDICTVMRTLERLDICRPFPEWEVRCITIDPPQRLETGLSPPVERAVSRLVAKLAREIGNGVALQNTR
ncbi:MAG: hydrogenase maturation protease [Chitinispirillaceae bacterium]|nr:hydrogenase maturation protease [Chitinispirillaceae bacterium]